MFHLLWILSFRGTGSGGGCRYQRCVFCVLQMEGYNGGSASSPRTTTKKQNSEENFDEVSNPLVSLLFHPVRVRNDWDIRCYNQYYGY
jgi:hypothetical protein